MRVAIIGATGLVGTEMLAVLAETAFPVTELLPVATEASLGRSVEFNGKQWPVMSVQTALDAVPDLALFSAGGTVSQEWAPRFEAAGTWVIDNSSAWRMTDGIPLIVSEVNFEALNQNPHRRLIANPNCTTMQLVVALKPLHDAFGLKRVIVSTYQSVTGTGKKAVDQLEAERQGIEGPKVYAHPIDKNVIPHCDVFLENGYTREEMKVVWETRKILSLPHLPVTCTAVRVPVVGGHSESVNVELEHPFTLEAVRQVFADAFGLVVVDNPAQNQYPTPRLAHGRNDVLVGRIRHDESHPNALNIWIVADNLRKGAATNAVQIAHGLLATGKLTARQPISQPTQNL